MHKTYLPFLIEYEESLVKKYKKPKYPVIAIGGFAGSGKDTFSEYLQKKLKKDGIDLPITQAGSLFRKATIDAGYSERELEKFSARAGPELDKQIENMMLEAVFEKGGIFVGRLAPFTIGDWGIKIMLKGDTEMIAKRISNDPKRAEYKMRLEEVMKKIDARNEADQSRLEKLYKISIPKLSQKIDLIIVNKGTIKETGDAIYNYVAGVLKPKG